METIHYGSSTGGDGSKEGHISWPAECCLVTGVVSHYNAVKDVPECQF